MGVKVKLCDKCFENGDHIKAVDNVLIESTQEVFDLCQTCIDNIRRYITDGNTGLSTITRKTKA